eukprot:TRINITY_DN2823_c0_g3_i1.p1 TRINITY_DN2823_c0_g3~~TRINITY_DN2823_c0_g3_i1.p1  ORF type:complete len:255 (-),score=36.59 TRINITY_DN2823_c0_g3_i1:251-1015(-)
MILSTLWSLIVLTLLSVSLLNCHSEQPKSNDPRKSVAFIYNGDVTDLGWFFQHDLARRRVQELIGPSRHIRTMVEQVDYFDETQFRELVNKSSFFLYVMCSPLYNDITVSVAKDYPSLYFLVIGGWTLLPNLKIAHGKMYEARYLGGMAAGLATKTNKIGFIGAFETNSQILRDVNSFALGMNSVNPNATLYVYFNDNFDSPELHLDIEYQRLKDIGIDVLTIFQDTLYPIQKSNEPRNVLSWVSLRHGRITCW